MAEVFCQRGLVSCYGSDVRMIFGTSVRVHPAAATLHKATRVDMLDEFGAALLRKSML